MEPDRFTLPRAETFFDTSVIAKYFYTMDINQTFPQQPIAQVDRQYTAFVTNNKVLFNTPDCLWTCEAHQILFKEFLTDYLMGYYTKE